MARTPSNDLKVVAFLTRHFTEKYSINQLARQIGITPKGMHKLLKRLESQKILIPNKIGNGIFYAINFKSDLALKTAELSLFEEPQLPYARVQAEDIQRLRPTVIAAVLFGSVLHKGDKAGDVDVMVVFEKDNYKKFNEELQKLQGIKPKHIHTVMQTPEDLIRNLKTPDPVILELLRTGKVLWGHELIVKSIAEAIE